jgi:crossover junction endodeoxyribonuclease RuvC
MLQQLLGLKELPKNLDSTDGLAAAFLSFFQFWKSGWNENYTGWDAFVKQNEERVRRLHAYPFCKQACHYCDFHFRLR